MSGRSAGQGLPMRFEVLHTTRYRYANPVTFGEHRLMFRPRAAHDSRVLDDSLEVSLPHAVRWIQDTFSNSVAFVTLPEPGVDLLFRCRFTIEQVGLREAELPLEPRAMHLPLQHSPDEWLDLQAFMRPHTEDPEGVVAAWAKRFLDRSRDTREVLDEMTDDIGRNFAYQSRDTEGTQSPLETLVLRSGTCRDYAWLMIEALRRLGIACRFVSGYLYDPALDPQAGGGFSAPVYGAGATHAWLNAFLPGAGWVAYDPTNRLTRGQSLIRVAYARHPAQAVPLAGSWYGAANDYLGMSVDVNVRRLPDWKEGH
jgi:transglutaminase-like putative cysteine protease